MNRLQEKLTRDFQLGSLPSPVRVRPERLPAFYVFLILALVGLLASGCEPYPRDPEGTLERIQTEGVLWVGVSARPPWTVHDHGHVEGIEARLVEELAAQLGVDVRWQVASEADLAHAIDRQAVDLAVAGYAKNSPWKKHVAFTKPYAVHEGEHHVWAVKKGENRWLFRIEEFLRDKEPEVLRALEAEEEEVVDASLR